MSEANQRSITSFFGPPKHPRDESSTQAYNESRPSKLARTISPTLSNSGSYHSLDSNLDKETNEDLEIEFISISTNKVSTLESTSIRADGRVWKWKEEYKELFKWLEYDPLTQTARCKYLACNMYFLL